MDIVTYVHGAFSVRERHDSQRELLKLHVNYYTPLAKSPERIQRTVRRIILCARRGRHPGI